MTQFANLPDDCYLLIFARLSNSTLLSCRRVSRAWLRNQQKVFRNRKSLILLHGNLPVKLLTKSHYQREFISHGIDQNGQPMGFNHFLLHNQVKLRTFNLNVTHFLTETFPNLDTLIVAHDHIPSLNVNKPLLDLLQLYSSQVVTLKLYFNYRGEYCDVINTNIRKVIRQLNSMTALEHVTVESYNPPGLALGASNNDLEFLTRVKEFYCYAPKLSKSWHDALDSLEQTGTVSQLEHVGIYNMWAHPIDHWPLANRFTHFPGSMFQLSFNLANFEQSIDHFGSLATFSIHDYCSRSLSSQLIALSQHCPFLVHIEIIVIKNCLFAQPFDPSTIKPFESVKALDLVFNHPTEINIHAQFHPLVHTFPNLVSIKIISPIQEPNLDAQFAIFFHQLKTAFGRESLRTDYSILN